MTARRLAVVHALHRAIADDAHATARHAVTRCGWPDDAEVMCELLDQYRGWLTSIVDDAVDEAKAHLGWSS